MEPIVKIESFWHKEPATCEPCFACDDIIYSDANRLCFYINNRIDQSDIVVCNSCYDLIKKDAI